MRSVIAALLLLAASPLAGASNAPARNVFPDLKHERVDYWVAEFSKDKDYHKKIAEGFERKAKYQDMLERKLRRRGMPQNLIYLAFEESAFNPEARSGQRAVGIWQLMPDTAKLYGLKVSKKTDDRLKVEKETDAALRFLDHLYRYFGSWYLAAAAYNAGERKIARIMKKTSAGTPAETATITASGTISRRRPATTSPPSSRSSASVRIRKNTDSDDRGQFHGHLRDMPLSFDP